MISPKFHDNKYLRVYSQIIQRAKLRSLDGYVEKHHILPTSLGGYNIAENIVRLTAREHFIVHELLIRFTSGTDRQKMCYALSFFRTSNTKHKRKLTARQYQVARLAHAEAKRGWKPSAKTCAAVSAAKRGIPLSQAQKDKMGKALKRQIPCWYLLGDEYLSHPDFYRFCLDTGVGRANVQAGIIAHGAHVLTCGKNKGMVLTFQDLGAHEMLKLRASALSETHQSRSAAVRKANEKKKPTSIIKEHAALSSFSVPLETSIHLMQEYNEPVKNALWFFDDELTKPTIIQSMLNNVAGKSTKIAARKTAVVELNRNEARSFLKQNHLQGAGSGAVLYIGLKQGDTLLSVMSFGKARYNPIAKYELLRFASLLGTVVVGGASKLMAYARTKLVGQIVSYADLRYGTGKVYQQLGFMFQGNSKPGYWYIKDGKRSHRSQFQKHKLKDLLTDFNPAETEIKNMLRHGYERIFDLGHAVYLST
jgi:hypothetical protein